MKIVVFGLTISSSWGNGHATLWRGLCNALHQRGHTVVFFERDVPYYAAHRDMWTLPGGNWIPYSSWDDVIPTAEQHLNDADVAMVTSYCPDGIAASDLVLSSPVEVRAFYDLDTPVTLDQLRAGNSLSYIGPRGLADFDVVLSYTGGRALDELKAQLGHDVPYLYMAALIPPCITLRTHATNSVAICRISAHLQLIGSVHLKICLSRRLVDCRTGNS